MSPWLVIFLGVLALAHADRELSGVGLGYFGGRVRENEFPHLISLQEGSGAAIRHRCGGSLINNAWVVTAAHCLVDADSNLMVKVGKFYFQNYAGNPYERTHNVVKKISHEKFLPGQASPHDIALLKLEKTVSFNDYVQPISLPTNTTIVPDHTLVTIAGWGTLFFREIGQKFKSYETLQKMTTHIVGYGTCKDAVAYVTADSSPVDETSNVCTGPMEGGEHACIGDPGGPLIRYYTDAGNKTKSELVGVISWGVTPCGSPGAPSIMTKISSYVDWIQEKIANN